MEIVRGTPSERTNLTGAGSLAERSFGAADRGADAIAGAPGLATATKEHAAATATIVSIRMKLRITGSSPTMKSRLARHAQRPMVIRRMALTTVTSAPVGCRQSS